MGGMGNAPAINPNMAMRGMGNMGGMGGMGMMGMGGMGGMGMMGMGGGMGGMGGGVGVGMGGGRVGSSSCSGSMPWADRSTGQWWPTDPECAKGTCGHAWPKRIRRLGLRRRHGRRDPHVSAGPGRYWRSAILDPGQRPVKAVLAGHGYRNHVWLKYLYDERAARDVSVSAWFAPFVHVQGL